MPTRPDRHAALRQRPGRPGAELQAAPATEFVHLRLLAINSHAGLGITHGVIARCLARNPRTDVIALQEVRSGVQLHRALGEGWFTVPTDQPGDGVRVEAGTYLALRSERFALLDSDNSDIRFGSVHARRLTRATVLDRWSGRVVTVVDVHPDPLGRGLLRSSPSARARQTRQLVAVERALADRPEGEVLVAAGDWNQPLARPAAVGVRQHSAHTIMGRVGLTAAHRRVHTPGIVKLMEVFVSRNAEVLAREGFRTGVRGMDHEVVFARLRYPTTSSTS